MLRNLTGKIKSVHKAAFQSIKIAPQDHTQEVDVLSMMIKVLLLTQKFMALRK